MKQIFFNELTLSATPEENRLWLEGLFKVLKLIASRTEKKVKRIFVEQNVLDRLYECYNIVEDNNLKNEIVSFMTGYDPNDKRVDVMIRDHYLGVEYSIEIEKVVRPCPSLGWAYLNDSITIGFASGLKWGSSALHQIMETSLEGEVRIVDDVVCVVNPSQLDDEYVRTWLDVNFGANVAPSHEPSTRLQREGRIIVLGVNDSPKLRQIVQDLGLSHERFEFYTHGQVKSANFNCARFRNSPNIAAILVGPVPHKVDGMGDAPGFVFALQHHNGYPPIEILSKDMEEVHDSRLDVDLFRSQGKLVVTPLSFRRGLFNLLQRKIIVAE